MEHGVSERIWYAGCWRTPEGVESHRASKRRADKEKKKERNSRRVRMRAGGIEFYVGHAPTAEDAQRIRRRIREEAPRA